MEVYSLLTRDVLLICRLAVQPERHAAALVQQRRYDVISQPRQAPHHAQRPHYAHERSRHARGYTHHARGYTHHAQESKDRLRLGHAQQTNAIHLNCVLIQAIAVL